MVRPLLFVLLLAAIVAGAALAWPVAGAPSAAVPGRGGPAIESRATTEGRIEPPRAAESDSRRDVVPGAQHPGGTGIVGVVRGPAGDPAPGAVVWLLRGDVEDRLGSVVADGDGRFAIPLGIDDGRGERAFRLVAHHPAHGLSAPLRVARPPGGAAERVDLRLDVVAAEVVGAVRGPAGDPVANHPVALAFVGTAPATGPEWRVGRDEAEITTAADGTFVARGMRSGRWEADFDVSGDPIGFPGAAPPPCRRELDTADGPVELTVPFVRIDLDVAPAPVSRIVVQGCPGAVAAAARAAFAAGRRLVDSGVGVERRSVVDVSRASFYAAPGSFLAIRAAGAGRIAETALDVLAAPAVRPVRLRLDLPADTGVVFDVRAPSGRSPSEVLLRLWRNDGLRLTATPDADVGSGWRRLPSHGRVAMPPGELRVEVLGDPLGFDREWFPAELAVEQLDITVPRVAGFVDQVVQLRTGAWLELEVVIAPRVSEPAPSVWLDEPMDDGTALIKASAALIGTDDRHRVARLAASTDEGRWVLVRGIPYRAGQVVRMRVLGAFAPGSFRLSMQTWRPASAEESAGWPIALGPGRNVLRLSVGQDAVLRWGGR